MSTSGTMSPLLAMLFLSLVVCSSYASQDIVLTLVKDDEVVNEYAKQVYKCYNAYIWLDGHGEVLKVEKKASAIGKDTIIIHIVARTITHPTSKITLDADQARKFKTWLGCDGKCLAKIIKKIAYEKNLMISKIIFWTSSIDVNCDYEKESTDQYRKHSLIVAFLSALSGDTTIAIATAGDTDSPHTIIANKFGVIEKIKFPYTELHEQLLECTTGEYRLTYKIFLFISNRLHSKQLSICRY